MSPNPASRFPMSFCATPLTLDDARLPDADTRVGGSCAPPSSRAWNSGTFAHTQLRHTLPENMRCDCPQTRTTGDGDRSDLASCRASLGSSDAGRDTSRRMPGSMPFMRFAVLVGTQTQLRRPATCETARGQLYDCRRAWSLTWPCRQYPVTDSLPALAPEVEVLGSCCSILLECPCTCGTTRRSSRVSRHDHRPATASWRRLAATRGGTHASKASTLCSTPICGKP